MRGRGTRSKARQPQFIESIDDAGDQRRLRADDCQPDGLGVSDGCQCFYVIRGYGDIADLVLPRGAGVAGRDKHLGDPRRLRTFPGQRVLATTGTDDKNLHRTSIAGARLAGDPPCGRINAESGACR